MRPDRFFLEPDTTGPDGASACAIALVCQNRAAAVLSSPLQPSMSPGRRLVAPLSPERFTMGTVIGIPDEYPSPHQTP